MNSDTPYWCAGSAPYVEHVVLPLNKRNAHHLIWKSCWTPLCVVKYK